MFIIFSYIVIIFVCIAAIIFICIGAIIFDYNNIFLAAFVIPLLIVFCFSLHQEIIDYRYYNELKRQTGI